MNLSRLKNLRFRTKFSLVAGFFLLFGLFGAVIVSQHKQETKSKASTDIYGDYHGDLVGDYYNVAGTVFGNIIGNYDQISNGVQGSIYGNANSIVSNITGCINGNNNRIAGNVTGAVVGTGNIVTGTKGTGDCPLPGSSTPVPIILTPTPTTIPPTPTPTPIPQNQNPYVNITSPSDGTFLTNPITPFSVSGGDNDGQVVKVDYYLNGSLVSSVTTAPFGTDIHLSRNNTCKINTGVVKVIATDNKGGQGSDSITISWDDGCPPTPTPTPVPGDTAFVFNLLLHGIGNAGDSVNPNGGGNKNPLHIQRNIKVEVFDTQNQLVLTKDGVTNFNSTNGNFTGSVNMGTVLASGSYTIKVKSAQFLRRLIPGIPSIIAGQTNQLSQVALINGDIDGNNSINILDYNILTGCYSDFLPPVSCTAANKLLADLNDDGAVNQFDYNLFLRELTNVTGQ